ncbi:hypothetical protein AMAG_16723 [Allomyces macrogynus ATCC 38327]|uniref:Mitochondrial carrier protein n=1 Tax=Allomyces macrogynus (strain ATCC 38327) TaxID=578462 RepID=A0A0L0TBZ5_ALLM3|nr:hypothetical protein AMAG_16723 [Allomyces macrogynus ATCC 38327]|eukprot:KNE72241.1 hypothetical protein AMAG_16723 [Allomyces macrogynus ATCC 38327]
MASSANDFIAGAVSGGLGVLVGNPLDVIKVRLQTAAAASAPAAVSHAPPVPVPAAAVFNASSGSGAVATLHAPMAPESTFAQVRRLVNREGVASLFRGASAPIMSTAAMNSMLFVSYSAALRVFQRPQNDDGGVNSARAPSIAEASVAGLAAGFACFLISTPTELIKCRAQYIRSSSTLSSSADCSRPLTLRLGPARTLHLPAHNALAVAAHVARTRGPLGFYRGGFVTLWRDAPGYAVYFGAYEAGKAALRWALDRGAGEVEAGSVAHEARERAVQFWAGGLAGVASWGSIYPLDVVKSRIQTTTAPVHPISTSLVARLVAPVRETWAVTQAVWHTDGARGFLRGLKPTLIRAFYVNAVTFLGYEVCMDVLERRARW